MDDTPKTSHQTSSSPVDFALLIEIVGDSDPDELFMVLELFLELFPEQFEAVEKALTDMDRQALHDMAHAAKSSSLSAAASPLAELLGVLEREAFTAPWDQLNQLAGDARGEFDRVRRMVSARSGGG